MEREIKRRGGVRAKRDDDQTAADGGHPSLERRQHARKVRSSQIAVNNPSEKVKG